MDSVYLCKQFFQTEVSLWNWVKNLYCPNMSQVFFITSQPSCQWPFLHRLITFTVVVAVVYISQSYNIFNDCVCACFSHAWGYVWMCMFTPVPVIVHVCVCVNFLIYFNLMAILCLSSSGRPTAMFCLLNNPVGMSSNPSACRFLFNILVVRKLVRTGHQTLAQVWQQS